MRQVFFLPELQISLRLCGLTPTSLSPLAGLPAAARFDQSVFESLGRKGVCDGPGSLSPEWRQILAVVADPAIQATVHVEGAGVGHYFAGSGVVVGMAQAGEGLVAIGRASANDILDETSALLGWRSVPDAPPLRADLSLPEFTTVAALADAYREEQLLAMIERRAANTALVSRQQAERLIHMGRTKPDGRWLVSVLSRFAPAGWAPDPAHLDDGAGALIARGWAKPGQGGLHPGPEIQTLCAGFSNVSPFLALGVGAPWAVPESAIFTRGVESFWCIEFYSESAKRSVSISRAGARAMEDILRRRLAALAAPAPPQAAAAAALASPQPAPVSVPSAPPRPAAVPAKPAPPPAQDQPQLGLCRACKTPLRPGRAFCTQCGTPAA